MTSNLLRAALVSLGALALTGCFFSQDPLISAEQAQQPFAAGDYIAMNYDEDGAQSQDWAGQLVWDGMASRGVDDGEQPEDFPLDGYLYRQVAPDTYAAMSPEDDGYWYAVVYVWDNGVVGFFLPDCEALSEEARTRAGVALNDEDVCEVESWDQLEEALLIYLEEKAGEIALSGALFPAG